MSTEALARVNIRAGKHMKNSYPEGFRKVKVPPGQHGTALVDHIELTDSDVSLENLRQIRDGGMHRITPPGRYTRLLIGGGLVMSDVPSEAWENRSPVYSTRPGDSVLLNGLGLGMVLAAVLKKGAGAVTVIEKSPDVIKLVAPHYADPRVTVIEADALEWKPPRGASWHVVWHDIWPTFCGDNLEQMAALKRKYRNRAAWQGAWGFIESLRAGGRF